MYISSPSKSSQLFIFKYKNRKPYLPARTSFVVNCTKPSVRPEGPKGHMQNWDTYFYNTIPRRVATFDIHQDFVSEIINAKRLELQKRDGGIKYRYQEFAFTY